MLTGGESLPEEAAAAQFAPSLRERKVSPHHLLLLLLQLWEHLVSSCHQLRQEGERQQVSQILEAGRRRRSTSGATWPIKRNTWTCSVRFLPCRLWASLAACLCLERRPPAAAARRKTKPPGAAAPGSRASPVGVPWVNTGEVKLSKVKLTAPRRSPAWGGRWRC